MQKEAGRNPHSKEEKIKYDGEITKYINGQANLYHLFIIKSLKLLDEKGVDRRSFNTGQNVKLQAEYLCQVDPEELQVNIGFEISNTQGIYIYGTNTSREGHRKLKLQKKGIIEVELENLNLLPGDYNIGIAIADLEEKASYDHYRSITQFKVYSNIHDVGLVRLGHKFIIDNKGIEGG